MVDKKKNSKKSSKGVPEIFEVTKKGSKETEVKELMSKEEPEDYKPPKKEIENENKQLGNILLGLGILVLFFLIVILVNYNISHFTHKDTKYKIVQEGNLIFYNTAFKEFSKGVHVADYNFYLRNDPRKLSNTVPFEGDYVLYQSMVLNSESDFVCNGYGAIAVANFVNVHQYFGSKVIKDENATCDGTGRYNYIQIEEGNETRIDEYGPGCYKISINGCEILEGTERFIIETFEAANQNLG